MKSLNEQLEEWLDLFYKYGDQLGPAAVQTHFLRILPDSLRSEVYKREDLKRLDLMPLVEWVRHHTIWERNEELAAQLLRPEKVMAVGDGRLQQRPGAPPGGRRQGALQDRRQPRGPPQRRGEPNPLIRDFKGCFHCGKLDHARTPNERTGMKGCPEFEALIKSNNGLPKGYKGKLELFLDETHKALGSRPRGINSVTGTAGDEGARGQSTPPVS